MFTLHSAAQCYKLPFVCLLQGADFTYALHVNVESVLLKCLFILITNGFHQAH